MSYPPALLLFGEMVLGLVRAAELKEQDGGGEIWDDESRRALLAARALGLHGQEKRVTPERVAELILQGLDLTIDQHEIGPFKVAVYPQLNFGSPISYSAEIKQADSPSDGFPHRTECLQGGGLGEGARVRDGLQQTASRGS